MRPELPVAAARTGRTCKAGGSKAPGHCLNALLQQLQRIADPRQLRGKVVMVFASEFHTNFDPANVTQPPWGTLTFTFTDCNHGRVDFTSVVSGYGTGHMDLTRLTQPAGLACP